MAKQKGCSHVLVVRMRTKHEAKVECLSCGTVWERVVVDWENYKNQ